MNAMNKSLWKQLLGSAQLKSEAQSANVVIFGDHGAGKRTLLNALLTSSGQSNDLIANENLPFRDPKKKSEHLYIFDYKYLRINKFEDDDNNELGKINFYVLNEKYPYFKDFINDHMMQNLSIVVVLDLEKPEAINDRFFNWIAFINQTFMNHLAEAAPEQREALKHHFEAVFRRNKLLYSANQNGGENESLDPSLIVDEDTTNIEFSLGVPILIIAHKSDALDTLDQKALDKIQLSLRTLAVRYGAAVIYTSARAGSNLDTLSKYFSYALLGDDRAKLNIDVTNDKLFIPMGFDHIEELEKEFVEARDYVFSKRGKGGLEVPEKVEGGEEIIDPEQFLQHVKEGKVLYYTGNREKMLPSNMQTDTTAVRKSIFEKPRKKVLDILGKRKE